MSDRHTLAANKLDDFSAWLIESDWTLENTKGEFEVLRARKEGRVLQLYARSCSPQHLTVMDKDYPIIQQYLRTRENIHLHQWQILSFIKMFSSSVEMTEKFNYGLCYWFSFILQERFKPAAKLMYSPVDNHFIVRIGDDLYDINGVVTDKYKSVVEWKDFRDKAERARIVRDCIRKENGL